MRPPGVCCCLDCRSNAGALFEPEPPPLVGARSVVAAFPVFWARGAGEGFNVTSESFGVAPQASNIFCAKENWDSQRHHTERQAPFSPSALGVLVPHCCLCHFRSLLLELYLFLWASLCVHKGEVDAVALLESVEGKTPKKKAKVEPQIHDVISSWLPIVPAPTR